MRDDSIFAVSFVEFLASPIGIAMAILSVLTVVQAIQRIMAARVLSAMPYLRIGDRRYFGMWPNNLFEYRGANGWQRILQVTSDGPQYDLPTEARRRVERDKKWERRLIIVQCLAIVAAELALVSYLIRPLPLSTLLQIANLGVIVKLYVATFHNISVLIAWLFHVPESSGWMYVIYYFVITQVITVPAAIFTIRHGTWAIKTTFGAFANEFLYLLGVQWIRGAKVFDSRGFDPTDSPRDDPNQPPDADDYCSDEQQSTKQKKPDRDPRHNVEDAIWLLDLNEPFTFQDLQAAFKKKVLAHHPDRWGDISDSTRKQLEEDLKVLNAARDLIKKHKRWK